MQRLGAIFRLTGRALRVCCEFVGLLNRLAEK
jgi:hypothetical protein